MKVAYFDCQFGAAGDMLCSALMANGLDLDEWRREVSKIALPDKFEIDVETVMRCGIVSKKYTVKCFTESRDRDEREQEHQHGDEHVHHQHDHDHEHDHHHHHHHHEHVPVWNTHIHGHSHGRSIAEIVAIIEESQISEGAKRMSLAIFNNLALAESKVHGVDPQSVHFHEVGAVDAILDIIGFSIAYDLLGIEKAIVSPLTVGGGTIRTEHGVYPVPGPATVYLIAQASAPTSALDLRFECLTPTGAAILTTIASRWGAPPAFQQIASVGYGAGTLDPQSHPNVVRTYIGNCADLKQQEQASSPTLGFTSMDKVEAACENQFRSEVISVIEANIDDCAPNIIAYALEQALSQGALDISVTPTTMKKGRSGHLVTVLARPQDRRRLEELILKETTTLGVRTYYVERTVLEREFAEVKLSDSWSIRVKIARDQGGKIVNVQPEYADCATYAERHGLTLRDVFEQALKEYATQMRT